MTLGSDTIVANTGGNGSNVDADSGAVKSERRWSPLPREAAPTAPAGGNHRRPGDTQGENLKDDDGAYCGFSAQTATSSAGNLCSARSRPTAARQ